MGAHPGEGNLSYVLSLLFTLIGADARRGKLTLFVAEAPRDRSALEHGVTPREMIATCSSQNSARLATKK